MKRVLSVLLIIICAASSMNMVHSQDEEATEEATLSADFSNDYIASEIDVTELVKDFVWLNQFLLLSVVGTLANFLWPKVVEQIRKRLFHQELKSRPQKYIWSFQKVTVVVIVIVLVLAAIEWTALLSLDSITMTTLRKLGGLSLLVAFACGYTVASIVEEFLRRR